MLFNMIIHIKPYQNMYISQIFKYYLLKLEKARTSIQVLHGCHWLTTSQIRDDRQPIGPSVALSQIQAQMASTTLKHDLDMVSQCLGLLYKANVDPAALAEVVVHAREACIRLKCSMHLEWVGFNRVHSSPPQ
jgi:hypothetical protein